MKKISTLMAMALTAGAAFSQSQRLVFVEEFTQASCPPCASQNPTFNATLNANPTKVVALKHQVWWPGYDPMYNHNPSDVNTRVAYYNVTGVPNAVMDGTSQGAPNTVVTTNSINTEYAVSSPFTIALSHSFSPDYLTINITCTITASQAISGTLKARVAIMERDIYFATQPGTNGETHFEGVMKKMLPDAEGTTLPTTWAVGDVQTLSFSVPVPWYTYDLNQVAVVAYVQDDADKDVKQAGYSAPIGGLSTADDAGISAVTGNSFLNCSGSVTPSITLKNFSTTGVLTSCNINYSVNNGPVITQAWTGSLSANGTTSVALPPISLGAGVNTISFYTSSPNGNPDAKPINNYQFATINSVTNSIPTPVTENFQGSVFPSTDWAINNPNNDDTWEKITGRGGFSTAATEASMFLNFYNITANKFDEMYLPGVSLVNNTSANIAFDVAYCQYQTELDQLDVLVSSDCGATWTNVFSKSGATLATAPASTANWAPTAAQWRSESASLSAFVGQNIIVKFKGTSKYGNNLFIDNINLTGVTGITTAELENSITIFPNPATEVLNVDVKLNDSKALTFDLVDVTGRTVSTTVANGIYYTKSIDLKGIAKGSYLLKIQSENTSIVKKVSVQ